MNPFKKLFLRDTTASGSLDAAAADDLAAFAQTEVQGMSRMGDFDGADTDDVWKQSSFDLRQGADIVDFSDTIPLDVFDKLFKKG